MFSCLKHYLATLDLILFSSLLSACSYWPDVWRYILLPVSGLHLWQGHRNHCQRGAAQGLEVARCVQCFERRLGDQKMVKEAGLAWGGEKKTSPTFPVPVTQLTEVMKLMQEPCRFSWHGLLVLRGDGWLFHQNIPGCVLPLHRGSVRHYNPSLFFFLIHSQPCQIGMLYCFLLD